MTGKMKRIISGIAPFAALAAAALMSQSCLNDDGYDYSQYSPNAIVTFKPLADGGFYMQLNDETTLFATNVSDCPYDEETRAFVNYSETDADDGEYDAAVNLNWYSDILTKDMVQVPDDVTDLDAEYGNDPLDIVVGSWMTVIEDGYFTIHFETYSDGSGRKHKVNLIQPDPSKPYELEFRHDAGGDLTGGRVWSVAAFRLSALDLPEGESVEITLKWNSFGTEMSRVFSYVPAGSGVNDGAGSGAGAVPSLNLI